MSLKNSYKTVFCEGEALLVEKKSKFIAHVKPVKNEEEALLYLASMRSKYADARHNVYAYVIDENNIFRYSDDGEPSGTAGMPVLDAIRKEGLVDVVVVVTRYFGGTLLGTGGLVHAYSQSAKQGILDAKPIEMNLSDILSVEVDYSMVGKIQHKFAADGYTLEDTVFESNVTFIVSCPIEKTQKLTEDIIEFTNGSAKCSVIDKKYVHKFI